MAKNDFVVKRSWCCENTFIVVVKNPFEKGGHDLIIKVDRKPNAFWPECQIDVTSAKSGDCEHISLTVPFPTNEEVDGG